MKNEHGKEHEAIEEQKEVVAAAPRMRGAWSVLKESYATWARHWKLFTGIQVIWAAVFLAILIVSVVIAGAVLGFSGALADVTEPAQMTGALLAHPWLLAVVALDAIVAGALVLIASAWVTVATVRAWQWARKEEHASMSVRNAYASTWGLVPGYIWISVIAGVFLALGYFGFVIPGILLTVAFTMLSFVAVAEGLKGRKAVMRTTRLAHPYLLTIAWRAILSAIVIYVPGQVVRWILNEVSDGLGDAVNQMYELVVSPIVTGILFATYLEIKAVERAAPHTAWFSLERLALMGAVAASVLVALWLMFGQG